MSRVTHAIRAPLWLEGLGDWAWPGRSAPEEVLPPPWVPAVPPQLPYALAADAPARSARARVGARPARALLAGVISALLAVCSALALKGSPALEQILGVRAAGSAVAVAGHDPATRGLTEPLPALLPVSVDRAGSSIDRVSFASAALGGRGAFLVYLPPGYAAQATLRYPVLYLLHGRDGHAAAFLEIGIQHAIDRLISRGLMPPVIAVMAQDRSSLQNWRNVGRRHSETYVVEVQELADQLLRTVPARAARAIAGSSMGGFGAMHVALSNPDRFAVVESWLGFFDGLEAELRAAAPVISRRGLYAFLYGAEADPVAVPGENPEFAATLRAAGADAQGVIYAGGHSLGKVKEHLDAGLLFAGRALQQAERREGVEQARARWRG